MTLTAKRLAEEEAEIRRALDSADLPPSVVEYRLTLIREVSVVGSQDKWQ